MKTYTGCTSQPSALLEEYMSVSMPQRLEALPKHSEMDKSARPASDARVPPIGVLGGSRSAKP